MGSSHRSTTLRLLIVAGALALPALTLLSGSTAYIPLASLPAVMLIPALIFSPHQRPPRSEDDHDDDGDGGSRTPDTPKSLPGGGMPLPDAVQARIRYRGVERSSLIPSRRRREHPAPVRRPVPQRVA
jgi:hypothetical protein